MNALKRSFLARRLHDAAWTRLRDMLGCKAESAGGSVVLVDPRGGTQRCSGCGRDPDRPKTLGERVHGCDGCGHVLDRDANAARNALQQLKGPGTGFRPRSVRAAARLGDARLTQRLARSTEIHARSPTKTFFAAAAGCEASVKGCCRMIEHPDYDAVSASTIVGAHRERTPRRMQGQPLCLLVQDGTDLNFATRHGCEGSGRSAASRGLRGRWACTCTRPSP